MTAPAGPAVWLLEGAIDHTEAIMAQMIGVYLFIGHAVRVSTASSSVADRFVRLPTDGVCVEPNEIVEARGGA